MLSHMYSETILRNRNEFNTTQVDLPVLLVPGDQYSWYILAACTVHGGHCLPDAYMVPYIKPVLAHIYIV